MGRLDGKVALISGRVDFPLDTCDQVRHSEAQNRLRYFGLMTEEINHGRPAQNGW